MKAFFKAMLADAGIAKINQSFRKKKGQSLVYGLSDTPKYVAFATSYAGRPCPMVIIVHDKESLVAWRDNLETLLHGVSVEELPEVDIASFQAEVKSIDLMARRMGILGRMMGGERMIVLATSMAAAQHDMTPSDFTRLSLRIATGNVMERGSMLRRLVELGYEHVDEVEHIGQFSTRGGIVDIFPINRILPVRVEFFDDEIDSIREFSIDSMRSVRNIDDVSVLPLKKLDSLKKSSMFLSYLSSDGVVVFDEPRRIRDDIHKCVTENPEIKKDIFSWEEMVEGASPYNTIYATLMLQKIHDAEPDNIVSVAARSIAPYQRQFHLLIDDVRDWVKQGTRVLMFMGDETKASSMREMLASHRIPSVLIDNPDELSDKAVTVTKGQLQSGFELAGAHLVVITDRDIFGHQKKKLRAPSISPENRISHFREINVGDYVVHQNHGIGKYLGVVTMDVGGVKRDYLHIKYGGDDKLFVPTDQVHLLQKYIGPEGEIPRLHRMGGADWAKAKAKAKASVEDIAKDLVKLYAKRRELTGIAFPPDSPWQREFEEAFPYEETEDQLKAVDEIKADMEKPRPMDRLLCGDVGFGKTEVAIRAAFKAVMGGYQVAVLVPTTVLAEQHFKTFSERFMDFGPTIDLVCRFRTAKEQRATFKNVKEGKVDILIGTHAILNQKKVQFKNLGLLIVDEEQRFGVKQKEKIKTIAAGIDVLTLSATPIPRTLHMSLVGARDMSVIETPPAERYPIQTYVVEANDEMIASAIRRELKRGGQVFFVYNRIDSIDKMRDRISAIVPEASIQTAHGRMPEEILESVMMDFYEGRFDVLLATSIVENGLDVQNANTIIVYDADYFGLSQLYQMRGRVGRSHRLAYAYFVYQRDKVLSETAEKRLQAMKEFAELGAGFKIAMRDLEIRGAGNLLGAEQSGHIMSVGFEMYCQLLDEAVKELKTGKPVVEKPEPMIEINVEAYIDGGYIDDAMHKIEIYQRIAAIRNEEQINMLLDELIDRFGEPTPPVMRLIDVARVKNYARDLGVRSIIKNNFFLELTLFDDHVIKPENIARLSVWQKDHVKLLMDQMIIRIKLPYAAQKELVKFILEVMKMLSGETETQKSAKK